MAVHDIVGAVALQRACFPPPFSEELLWNADHLARHLEVFPEGQFVAVEGERVLGSASATRIDEAQWRAHANWEATVGGPYLNTFAPQGSTLYGLDISVHPEARGQGIARRLYNARFDLVRRHKLRRYGTGCRIPGFRDWAQSAPDPTPDAYVRAVVEGTTTDRTLTPLLRLGLRPLGAVEEYMEDEESANAAALLEWIPNL